MEKVIQNLDKLNLKYGDSIIIGVSGGPDSMFLLEQVVNYTKGKEIEVVCAHINHNVRKESEEEKVFVHEYCIINKVVFEYMKIDTYGDDNFHNEARTKRYEFFNNLAEKYNSRYLLTAHHGDDLIETILMRIVRGSTLKGYSGFSELIKKENYTIARPLINVTKDEIITYLKDNKRKYMRDASNDKDVYTRNRFRKYIVANLKKEDPKVHDKFYKFSKVLLEYNEFIDKQVEEKIKRVFPQNILNIEEFKKEEKVIQKKIVYYILENLYEDDLMLVNDQHVKIILNLIHSIKASGEIHLPNNWKIIKSYNNITIIENKEVDYNFEIEIDDYVNLPNAKNIKKVDETSSETNNVCRLSKSDVKFPLYVRNKKNGDKICIKGMLGSKKLSDIFIDKKIPAKDRNLVPVVIDSNNNIVWLPGIKKSKYCKTKSEKYDIILKYY